MFFVDTGSGFFDVFGEDEKDLALECAENALQAAEAFHRKMGFVPFWGKRIEIRRGRAVEGLNRVFGEDRNQEIVRATKVWRVLSLKVEA